ncbi:pyruvate dehydrogenase E1 component subunit alpha [Waddlia chondrophila 2032/99]|uniref:Pyruvate dehydrogenase E1 component subunit alpha n=1 Tax=Waddlia chondrophila 2032/99 TaxID=765953 RepID=F8LE23_9BACT|nr:pyruvate dehydrogenase E1 component subunit alpha [Waddlia chondrophila 2032/99]
MVLRNQKNGCGHFFPCDNEKVSKRLGKEALLEALEKMVRIRNFELRAESAYLQGKIGGFFHSYMGQEAIQTAAVDAFGINHWWITSYRCHALALLLGATTDELMSELFGRANGNALGRGGSMHLYTDRMLGGFGIVTGQVPIATGAAFALKYQEIKDQAAICFLGDGAVAQGSFHESLNLASLWNLPIVYVIENNRWGMGTAVNRAISINRLAEDSAPAYNMKAYTVNGMDYMNCHALFEEVKEEVLKTSRPVLIEAVTERFRGHSISDPGLYRTKEALKEGMKKDPIQELKNFLEEKGWIDEEAFKEMDKEMRETMLASLKHADESPWPDPVVLEEDVYAP